MRKKLGELSPLMAGFVSGSGLERRYHHDDRHCDRTARWRAVRCFADRGMLRTSIHADQSKSGEAIGVPLNNEAVVVLRQQLGMHPLRVFTYRGKLVLKANTKAWRQALVRAGIVDFRWHDLRHTWASWHVQSGTPLYILQELGGWSDVRMAQRYAHLAPEHLASYAGNISGFKGVSGTFLATPEKINAKDIYRKPL